MGYPMRGNKNGVKVENRPIRRVQPINLLNHMTQANHKLSKQLLNLHAIFVRLSPALDIGEFNGRQKFPVLKLNYKFC